MSNNRNQVAVQRPPMPPEATQRFAGMDVQRWRVLTEGIYPGAKTAAAIMMVLDYCDTRGLDVMKRPVHIVSVYDSERRAYVETFWPGIGELRTTAHRTGAYAGIDETVFGPTRTKKFRGKGGNNKVYEADATYPEFAQITVYKMLGGQRVPFVGPKVFWEEWFAGVAGARVPNARWASNPFQMIEKCAEAAALRRAFPEEIGNEYTSEEMEGKTMSEVSTYSDGSNVIEGEIAEAEQEQGPSAEQLAAEFLAELETVALLENFEAGRAYLKTIGLPADEVSRIEKIIDEKKAAFLAKERTPDVIASEIRAEMKNNAADAESLQMIQQHYETDIENLPANLRSAIEDEFIIAFDELRSGDDENE